MCPLAGHCCGLCRSFVDDGIGKDSQVYSKAIHVFQREEKRQKQEEKVKFTLQPSLVDRKYDFGSTKGHVPLS